MLTLALQLGQLLMFQTFEQTMAYLMFETMDPYNWNETEDRFKIPTPYLFKRELSLQIINVY